MESDSVLKAVREGALGRRGKTDPVQFKLGKSKWGLSNGGLGPLCATRARSSAIVHICGPFGLFCKREFPLQNEEKQ